MATIEERIWEENANFIDPRTFHYLFHFWYFNFIYCGFSGNYKTFYSLKMDNDG